jgi:RNA polymerase sigma-70 factor (ECF subfamily)
MSEANSTVNRVEPETWATIYERIYQRALRLVRRLLPAEEKCDAEDWLNEAFLRLLERRPCIDGLEKPESFAFKVIQNVCIDRCKSPARLSAAKRVSIDADSEEEE